MKKLIVLLIAASFFSTLEAQPYKQQIREERNQHSKNYEVTYNHNNNYSNEVAYTNDRRSNEYNHQQSNQSVHRNYPQRTGTYKNNYPTNAHERHGNDYEIARERQQKAPSFGKGLAVGAIAGILFGVIVSR